MRARQHAERRKRFRRQSDRNFTVSITMMFTLTFILGCAAGWYLGVEQTAKHSRDQLRLLQCVDNTNRN